MFDDLDAFFYENAVAAYTEHVGTKNSGVFGQSKDLRTAVNAAAALYHFREHIPESHRQSRAEVASACSDYDLLGDVVNAAKHRDLTDSRKRTPLIRSAKDIQHFLVITEYRDAQGDYRLLEKEVTVRLLDGTDRNLLNVLTNVINFWMDELERIGVGRQTQTFHGAGPNQPSYARRVQGNAH